MLLPCYVALLLPCYGPLLYPLAASLLWPLAVEMLTMRKRLVDIRGSPCLFPCATVVSTKNEICACIGLIHRAQLNPLPVAQGKWCNTMTGDSLRMLSQACRVSTLSAGSAASSSFELLDGVNSTRVQHTAAARSLTSMNMNYEFIQ